MRRAGVLPPSMCGSQGLRCARRRSRPMSERRRRFCVGSTLASELPTRSILRSRNGFGQRFPLSIKNWRQAQGSLEYQWSQHEATRNSPPCPVSASTSTLKTRCPASGLSADQLRGGRHISNEISVGRTGFEPEMVLPQELQNLMFRTLRKAINATQGTTKIKT